MKLIVGLGNPGKEYKNTLHNAGFMAIDKLLEGFDMDKRKLKLNKKFESKIIHIKNKKLNIMICKPLTFMNNSGDAVLKTAKHYKIDPKDIWVIYDDIDIKKGSIKIKKGGSSAGHKGVESIIDKLKRDDFLRFRIGIGPSSAKIQTRDYILKKLNQDELDDFIKTVQKTADAVIYALNYSPAKAMNRYNKS